MTTYAADNAFMFYPCRYDDTTSALHRRTIARNDEIWFRMYGDSLQFNHRCPSSSPISISVDGGAWSTAAGFTTFSTSTTNLSTNVLPGGTTDAYHDIRIRTRDGGNWIALRLTDGVVITSTGGTAELARHPDAGEYERVRGTRGLAYWRDNFTDTTNNASFTSPIFPRAQVISGSTKVGRNAYAEFYVNGATNKLYAFVQNGTGGQDITFGLWVGRKRYTIHTTPATTDGTHGLMGPITVPGSGTRLVRLVNLYALDAVVVNGAFVDTAVDASPLPKLAWVGDSVTAGDSVTTAFDASGNWDHLCEILSGKFKLYNRGLSGAAVAAFNSNSRANDIPADCTFVINNLSINDATAFNSSPVATRAAYVTMYQAILARCTSATLICVPQLPYQSTNRTAVITGIQGAVTDVADARCVYASSDGWVSGLNDVSHPRDMGKAQACGGGVAAIRVTAQPADTNTITINGTVFEFDDNASVTGGNTSVTIGAALVDTIENLALAIEAAGAAFTLFERVILTSDTTNQGVVVRGCTSLSVSGANLTAYGPETTGWMTLIDEYFPADGDGGGGGGDAAETASGPSYRRNGTDIVIHAFEWVSDVDGNATLVSGTAVSGQIEKAVFIPSETAAPTASYDVTLTDEDDMDVLSGQGANLSDTASSAVRPGTPLKDGTTTSVIPTVVDGLLTLNVSNAGDAKAGRVVVYVR